MASMALPVVVIGKESAGKSQLVAALTGRSPRSSNFRGSTLACETYEGPTHTFIDTPGIVRQSDSQTTALALARLADGERVLLVVQATHLDDDLADLLPLAAGKQGAIVVTFWDKVRADPPAQAALDRLSRALGLALVPVDARALDGADRRAILAALDGSAAITGAPPHVRAGWRLEPPATWLEHRRLGPLLALSLLLLPALVAVWAANTFAGLVDPLVQAALAGPAQAMTGLPGWQAALLVGRYGFLTMGPLLFVWAVPTVVLYALLLGGYKASGLLDRLTVTLHPLLRPFGLSGRDLVRVLMGFGCNVPAVVSTRACSACSRGTCISAIAFGAACSYQFGATLAVFAAAQQPLLIVPYLVYLTATTLVYTRLVAPPAARARENLLLIERRAFLEWPRPETVWREARGSLHSFFRNALPIFAAICVVAATLDWLGVLDRLAGVIGPFLAPFRLPASAALPVIMAAIRKDGILLFATQPTAVPLSAGQLLTGVYLAGVLLPCLVTALTIAREQSVRFVFTLLARQALAACSFALLLAWGTALLGW